MDLEKQIQKLIDDSLKEDVRSGDITTCACIPLEATVSGKFLIKQSGTIAGLPFLDYLFKKIHLDLTIEHLVEEGSFQKSGTAIAKITGSARAIVTGERTALNLLQHASGVATITSAFVKKIQGLPCEIYDTRRTLPGMRALEKYAVKAGGGKNHRLGLDDHFIIKKNHLAFFSGITPHAIVDAIKKAREYRPGVPVEVEIEDEQQLMEALKADADAIILLNTSPDEAKKLVEKVRKKGKKVYIQSSNTMSLETVRAYAESGADAILTGLLTYSVKALEISFRLSL